MRVRELNLDRITKHGGLRFNVKKSHDFLSGYMTLNLDRSCLVIRFK